MRDLDITPEIEALLAAGSPISSGVSGGKDSYAVAIAVERARLERGWTGEHILTHSHLGKIEHADSLPACRRLADHLKLELVTVEPIRDMIERWRYRWASNVRRYVDLECVKLILPWSTPEWRFCTSEEKENPICQMLTKRWPGQKIISVTGIRGEESSARAKAPVWKENPKLTRKTTGTTGVNWNAIHSWKVEDVWSTIRRAGVRAHDGYARGMSRISCAYCIMSNDSDLRTAATDPANFESYRDICALEIESAYSFQSEKWLSDVAPDLLTLQQRADLDCAKRINAMRAREELRIPKNLLYTKGWPTCVPDHEEGSLLASVRFNVSEIMGFEMKFVESIDIRRRYKELMDKRTPSQVQAAKDARPPQINLF